MTVHISRSGVEEDEDGFLFVTCDCGATIGFAPDNETLLDMAMEHAWAGGVADASNGSSDAATNDGEPSAKKSGTNTSGSQP